MEEVASAPNPVLKASGEVNDPVQSKDIDRRVPINGEQAENHLHGTAASLDGTVISVDAAKGKDDATKIKVPVASPESEMSSGCTSPRHNGTIDPVQEYHLKWIQWNNQNTAIITQNENGPCPLIAIMNVLLLRGVVEIPQMIEIVTANQLYGYLGNTLLQRMPKDATETVQKNFEQNINDAMEIVSKLQTGLDVNVKFTGVQDFEYTQECVVFDLLNISLVHGWLYDPQNIEMISAIGTCSYNQLVEKIIANKSSADEDLLHQGLLAEQFLESSAAQLTYHGLCELNAAIKDEELCVLFRNNHFSTICKHNGSLYVLVTDHGFLTSTNLVWESLTNVEGDSLFYDGSFQRCIPSVKPINQAPPMSPEQQIDSDFLVALTLEEEQKRCSENQKQKENLGPQDGLSDQELARRLQQEEDFRAAQMVQQQEQAARQPCGQQQQGRQQPGQQQVGANQPGQGNQQASNQSRRREEKNCRIL